MLDQWIRVQPGASAGVIVDPYYEWARRTEFRYFFAGENRKWFPVAIQVRKPKTAQQFATGDWHRPPDWENWLSVSSLFADPPPDLRRITYCAATAPIKTWAVTSADPSYFGCHV